MESFELSNVHILILFGVVVITIIVKIVQIKKSDKSTVNATPLLQKQAAKRNGIVKKDWIVTGDQTLHVDHNGIKLRISPIRAKRTHPNFTKVIFSLKKKGNIFAEINTKNTVFGVKNYDDVSVGSDIFKREFNIKSNNSNFILNLFNDHIQETMINLKTKYQSLAMTVHRRDVTLSMNNHPSNEEEYDDLINSTFKICNRLIELGWC